MQSHTTTFVTIEQAGAWVERRTWFDQNQATRLGLNKSTLDDIINKHRSGAVRFSAIVDGTRRTLDTEVIDDFIFEIVWLQTAGLFNASSQGNCKVRGRSIQVFLADKLTDLSCPSAQTVLCPVKQIPVNGYHRAVRQIQLSREDVTRTWPPRPTTNTPSPLAPIQRDDLMDALLLAASTVDFPSSAIAFFEIVRTSTSSLGSAPDIELEQVVSGECPVFWKCIQHCWSDSSAERKQRFSDFRHQEAIEFTFKENNRLFYKWDLILDGLLINMIGAGRPKSHAELLLRVQGIVASEDGGPGRTETDRHFKRFNRFFRATAGSGIQASSKGRPPRNAKTIRRPANRRSP
jgi:hypothetical protein